VASNLQTIITKIRRLTRSPSVNQISDNEIEEYINTFVLYDMPEDLRLFTLRVTLTWWVQPNIDEYNTDATAIVPQLVDFNQNYITTHPPMYCAGFKLLVTQEREEFFNYWPFTNNIISVGSGNGANVNFAGTLSAKPVLRNNVTFASIDGAGNGLQVHDDGLGNIVNAAGTAIVGAINYVTGVFNFTYPTPPGNGQKVNAETVPYVSARPTSILYYANKFTVRPVPDQPYPIIMEVYKRPTALINANQDPELQQWWQYIAYGAAVKIFQDRSDLESASNLMPEFDTQRRMVLRRTSQQYANERSRTMYVDQTNFNGGYGSFRSGFY